MIRGCFADPAWPVPTVQAAVAAPQLGPGAPVPEFLVDTGATRTCLHPADVVAKFGVDPSLLADSRQWSRHVTPHGVGGQAIYYPVSATFAFLHDDLTVQEIQEEIWVAQLRDGNETLPSLLGWDVLRHFELVLNWGERVIWLR